jgi:hypothetical protein
MTIYAAEPDSPAAHALALLASWAATQQPTSTDARTEPAGQLSLRPAQLDGIDP